MADQTNQNILGPGIDFPPVNFPTIFADGIMNFANTHQVAKFYVYRLDPSMADAVKNKVTPVAQIVLPVEGFVNAFAFFSVGIQKLIDTNAITKEKLDEMMEIAKAQARG